MIKGIAATGAALLIYDYFIGLGINTNTHNTVVPVSLSTLNTCSNKGNEGAQACFENSVNKTYSGGGHSGKEFEAKWLDIDVDDMRKRILENGGKLIHENKKYLRYAYSIPNGYVRVRREYDENGEPLITLTSKTYKDENFPIEHEINIDDSFEAANQFLKSLQLNFKAYQETYREKYSFDNCNEIVIDTIPGFNPYIEIDCSSKSALWKVAEKLGLDKTDAKHGSFANIYEDEYGISKDLINEKLRKLTFGTVYDALEPYVIRKKDQFKSITDKYNDK